jgi:multisubunit Na+/H+ antiporter MnhB subunit
MKDEAAGPQINISKIPGGGGVAGAMFAISSVLIFLIGIPRLRFFLAAAFVVGCGVALAMHLARRLHPRKPTGTPWIPT